MYKSPLLFPVRLEGNKIFVLDELMLPFKEEYIKITNLEEATYVLSKMKTRALGQVLLFFYCAVLFKELITPKNLAKIFKEKRPTFDFELLAEIIEKELLKGKDIQEIVENFILSFDAKRRKRAYALAKDLPHKANILTICNINGELIYLYEELQKLNKKALFYVCETRPYLQGSRLTFWELNKNKIPAKLICDNQCAYLMKQGKINVVIVGADRASLHNDIINKIGTYPLACLAKYFGIPFYALIQYPQDIDINRIPIEERPGEEVFMFLEKFYSEQVPALYPSFDITKGELISKVYEIK